MNILIVGSGGREYSLGKKIKKSPLASNLYFARGNGGTTKFGVNIDIEETDIKKLADFAKNQQIDLTIVGPENPIALGIADYFQSKGLKIFAVDKKTSLFESSKDFTKKFLNKYDIPTAVHKSFKDGESAKKFLYDCEYPIVLKADGLAYGKGVFIAENYTKACESIDEIFAKNGLNESLVVIEQYLIGKEVSSICLVSHNRIIPLPLARDFKKIGHNDTGENTGGVGCVCPVEDIEKKDLDKMQEITQKIEKGLIDGDYDYTGVLFIGYIITDKGPYVLEFNVRFGDPETEAIMEKVESDILRHILDTLSGTIKKEDIKINDKHYLGVVACSKGYPRKYEKGYPITSLGDSEAVIIHCATKYENEKYYTNGGRVLMVIGEGDTPHIAREKAYNAIKKINFENIYYRKDIK